MRKLAWLGVAVVIACALVAWRSCAARPAGPAGPVELAAVDGARTESSANARGSARLEAPASAGIADSRTALAAESSAESAANTLGTWRVLVVAAEDGRPLAGIRLTLRPIPNAPHSVKNVAANRGDETHAPVSDDTGRATFEIVPGASFVLAATREGALPVKVESELAALAPGEVRDVRVELATAPNCVRYGRVLDADTRLPIADARIATRSLGARAGDGPAVPSDPTGLFAWPADASVDSEVQVDARGYAPRLAWLDSRNETPERALEIELSRAAALVVRVSGEPGAGGELRVEVEFSLGDLVQPDPDPAPNKFRVFRARDARNAPVDADGAATFDPLPARVSLKVVVTAGKTRVANRTLTLQPGERRELDVELGGAAAVVGTLRERTGGAIRGQRMLLVRTGEARPVPPLATTTRTDGSFEFADVEPGSWNVAVDTRALPEGEPGWIGEPRAIVVGPHDRSVEVELVVDRALAIEGRVVDDAGRPVANARVFAGERAETLLVSHVEVAASADGRFRCAPLTAGEWQVWAVSGEPPSVSPPVGAKGGATGIELVLATPRTLSVAVLDRDGARATGASLTYFCVEPPSTSFWMQGLGSSDCELTLTPGKWSLVALASDGRIAARAVDVVANAAEERIELTLEPGATLVLRTAAAPTTTWVAHDDVRIAFDAVLPGSSQRVVVPAGRTTIEWTAPKSGEPKTRSVTLAAGTTLDVDLDAE